MSAPGRSSPAFNLVPRQRISLAQKSPSTQRRRPPERLADEAAAPHVNRCRRSRVQVLAIRCKPNAAKAPMVRHKSSQQDRLPLGKKIRTFHQNTGRVSCESQPLFLPTAVTSAWPKSRSWTKPNPEICRSDGLCPWPSILCVSEARFWLCSW